MNFMFKIYQFKNFITGLYKKYWWLTPLTIFFIWRIFLEAIGQYFYLSNLSEPSLKFFSESIWWRWDSSWYGSIVNHGYYLRPGLQSNTTFFPLYPLLWKAVMTITGFSNYLSAMLVSNSLALGGFLLFYRWGEIKWNKKTAKLALIALAVFPTSFFLISVYSESTLFILVSLTFLLAERGDFKWAALAALLAGVARPVGIFLWPILIWFWWSKSKGKNISKSDLFTLLVLPPLGLLFFSLYMWQQVGTPWVWLQEQGSYGRSIESPIKLLYAYIINIFKLEKFWVLHFFEMTALLFAVVCLPKLKKIHPAYAFFVILNLLPSLFSNTLMSLHRFILPIIPLFIVVAHRKRVLYYSYLLICCTLLIFCVNQFINNKWVG